MRIKSAVPYVFLIGLFVSVALIIQAKTTGQIKGTVVDRDTKNPIADASVLLVGAARGALTDLDGRFVIKRVEPGTYSVRIMRLEYNRVIVTGVVVKPDITTDISAELTRKISDRDVESSVVDCRDILEMHETSTDPAVSKEVIEARPVSTIDELLGHIRGGDGCKKAHAATNRSLLGQCAEIPPGFPPAHGGTAIVNGEAFDAMFFKHYGVNPFVDTEDDHLSTFAIDVDDASYVMARSYLDRGALPPDEAVRTEEFVNHFGYGYDPPHELPFRVFLEGAPSKFGQNCRMLKIGIKGKEIAPENRKAANLVFVIDVSGSMAREDRLGLVKKALRLLLDELRPDDRVGIVIYGSRGQVVLEPTSIEHKSRVVSAIESLCPGGSTNAEEGLTLGYDMADRQFEPGKINRVILCSDGVANVGRTKAEDLLRQIKKYAQRGITLSSIGFGMANYNDILLEKLGNSGNGHYAYVDNLIEAKRIFVDNLTGNLQVIARDVKIQVDFNREVVRSYRLLGYENRDVDDDKFRDDKEDGGEIGAGHEVTALYEIKLHEDAAATDVGTVFIRFRDPDQGEVTEISRKITGDVFAASFDRASFEFRLAACAAEFAEILRKSYWARDSKLSDLLQVAKGLVNETDSSDVIELMGLISKAQKYQEQLAEK